MCGIAGIINFNDLPISEFAVKQMTCALSHRGPDAEGFFINNGIALGHRRLSILDLSTGANQPFFDNSGRYIIVFNGEMYNFKEVKLLLPEYNFKTTGDTEVLIAAFAKWGAACIEYFKGMFAFAIWDTKEKSLTVARDRLGVKPLYYYQDNDTFIFASEIRSILSSGLVKRKIDPAGLYEFLSYQSIGYPLTIIEGIQTLEAGSYIVVKNKIIKKKVYWDVTNRQIDFDVSNKKLVTQHIYKLLSDSVERRLISDVPVGAFLSGGIDSSAVVGLMAKVSSARPNTFTISFDEKAFDESPYADIIAKKFNTIHNNIRLKPGIFLDELENALNALDSPSGDGINTYVVSKAIRNAGITVALSGVGGDELFAGYPFFFQYLKLQQKGWLYKGTGLLRQLIAMPLSINASNRSFRMQQIIKAPFPSIENMYPVSRQILSPELIDSLTFLGNKSASYTALWAQLHSKQENIEKLPLLSQVSVAEYLGYTQHTLLTDTDQMSMAVSLEVREPFFDQDLVEFIMAVPDAIKYPHYPKSLLVESVKPLLPDEIVHRKKQGFLLPWNVWMKKELRTFCETRLKNLCQRSFINGDRLIDYWNRFLKDDPSIRWTELWLFVVIEYWMEKNNVEG
jgi:asparagine synthase (glutamine-hydrolysing)